MKYEKPEMEVITFGVNIYMALSLETGAVKEDDGDMEVEW